MFLEFQKGKFENLRFHALMSKDVKFNIEITKNKEVRNQATLDKLETLYRTKNNDKFLMKNLKIPIFWTIYKNR